MAGVTAVTVGNFLRDRDIAAGNSCGSAKFDDSCLDKLYDKNWLSIGLAKIVLVGEYITKPGPHGACSKWENVEKERNRALILLEFGVDTLIMKVKNEEDMKEAIKIADMVTKKFGCKIAHRHV